MTIVILKIFLSVLSVVFLAWIAERGSPKVAGILTGFPIGTAIITFFIGYENGPEIASKASLYSLAALSINPIFALAYYWFGRNSPYQNNYIKPLCSALIVYFIFAYTTAQIQWNIATAILFLILTAIVVNIILNKTPGFGKVQAVKTTAPLIALRIFLAASIVLIVTQLVTIVGPKWAGVFTPFPLTFVPLLIILHASYGKNATFSLIKGFGYSFLSTGVYLLVITIYYPTAGVFKGTLLGFVAAGIFLYSLEIIIKWLKAKK